MFHCFVINSLGQAYTFQQKVLFCCSLDKKKKKHVIPVRPEEFDTAYNYS